MTDLVVNRLSAIKMGIVQVTKFVLIINAKLLVGFQILVQNLLSVYLTTINLFVNANQDFRV